MSRGPENASFLSAYLKYSNVKSPVTSKSMGSLDSKVASEGPRVPDSSPNCPKPYEIRGGYMKAENRDSNKYASFSKFLKSTENKNQACKDWLMDFPVEKIKTVKQNFSLSTNDCKDKEVKVSTITNVISKSPLRNKISPKKSPKTKSHPISNEALQASPSQNLRQGVRKDSKAMPYSGKRKYVKRIRFNNNENTGMKRNLRVRKRKRQEEPEISDSDSEISFKPKPKRRKFQTTDSYIMAPLKARVKKHEKAVKGLQQTIAEKRALKRREKQNRLNKLAANSVSPSKHGRSLRIQRKRKQEALRSSPRTKNNQTAKSYVEMEDNTNVKRVRKNLRLRSDSPSKQKFPVIKRRRRKVKSKAGLKINENENTGTPQQRKITCNKENSEKVTLNRRSSLGQLNKKSSTVRQQHRKSSPVRHTAPKSSPGKQTYLKSSPDMQANQKSSPVKCLDHTLSSQEDSPKQQKPALAFSSLAGTTISRPLSYRLTSSPKLNGLPAVLSLNTLSGIPHKIQGSTFTSVRPGFGSTAFSGSQSLPATPTPSTSEMGFFRSSPRPNTLSFSCNSNSSPAQVVNNKSSSQSALDSSNLNDSACSFDKQSEKVSRFTKIKDKRTLSETVDMLRHASSLNGVSVLKNNSFSKKTLTPSDDHSSRNSSRSVTPNVTPIKSEVLTPSCTPCSTPKKSPSCSPAPSLDRIPVTRLKREQKYLFQKGHDVLAQWHDGLYYLGSILKIEENTKRCLLRYEDNSKYWSLFKDIHRGAKDGEMICCVCMGESSEKPNEIVLCDNCGQGYHQNCHTPIVGGSEILDPDDEWRCRKCIFALTIKAGGALKEGKYADELRQMKLTLPYDMRTLTWDAQHKTNVEQYYCYCGGPGIWYQKMIQCCRCKQWFHEACIQCLEFPLLYADSFYIFVCSPCNFGEEYIKRLSIDWPDLVHIALFNLTMERNQKYYEQEDEVMMWIDDNWDALQVKEYDDLDPIQRAEHVAEALSKNKARFKNGNEIRKSKVMWGLRVRVPPPRTHITLPVDGLVNDEVMKKLKVKGRRSKVFIPVACKSPVQIRHSPLQLKRVARRKVLQQSQLAADEQLQGPEDTQEQLQCEEIKPQITGPLLDRLIPPLSSYTGHNHPFKHEIEQTLEKIEMVQRTAIWQYVQSKDNDDDDNVSVSPDGPPVLVKEEPVEAIPDMSPPLSEISEASSRRGKSRKSNTPKLINAAGLKRSRRISCQKLNNFPPNLEQTVPPKPEISVTKVRSAKANYLCAFDKLGYGKGLHILGKRESNEGKLDYLISW